MDILRIVCALILTPFVLISVLLMGTIFLGFVEEYGDDILGWGFILGWLALTFAVIYKIL